MIFSEKNAASAEWYRSLPLGTLCVDLCNMPFEDATLDLIISEDILEQVINHGKALKESKTGFKT